MSKNSGNISYQRGCWAEQKALEYLLTHHLKLLGKNFRSTFGEIDLIMQEKNIILFIEVRYRSSDYFHTALESINKKKCERIISASHQYLTENRSASQRNCRFDVIALSGSQASPKIEWIKNAFQT